MSDLHTRINWHSASYSALKIELSANADDLDFITEYPLNKHPRRIDMLVVRKDPSAVLENPIARNFRRYNLVEYKGPSQSLGVRHLIKAASYALSFCETPYKTAKVHISEVTLTLITYRFPTKMFKILSNHNFTIEKYDDGIYTIDNPLIPLQVIVTRQLDAEGHIWLKSLGSELLTEEEAELLAEAYWPHRDEAEYSNYMEIITRANRKEQKGEETMCNAILEMIEPKLKERWEKCWEDGHAAGHAAGMKEGHAAGMEAGHAAGMKAGMEAGMKAGHAAGLEAGMKISRMDRAGKSLEEISAACGIPVEKVRELLYG